ncbi:MAG: hypothetical protein HY681_06250 [Chloroflexi bacterium]|nr:hypothetical protein [Chloroflexota bacterium]
MYRQVNSSYRRVPAWPVLLLAIVTVLIGIGCELAPAPAPTPSPDLSPADVELSSAGRASGSDSVAPASGGGEPPPPLDGQPGGGGASAGQGGTSEAYGSYQWLGNIVVSGVRGIEMARPCDGFSWALAFASPEEESKAANLAGKKVVVWGSPSPISSRRTIQVEAVYDVDGPMPEVAVPGFPCPGTVTPQPTMPSPVALDLQPGEIAATGKMTREGANAYLETPSGRIALTEVAPETVAVPPSPPVETRPGAPAAGAAPSYAGGDEYLVVGKWRIEAGQLIVAVRYMMPWGYAVPPEPVPSPMPGPSPIPQPGGTLGVLYGQVRIGPLCPVEPCTRPTGDLYSSRSLVVESAAGSRIETPLTPDGWFKVQLAAGAYVVTLTNCDFLGCRSALPQKVTVQAGQVAELAIEIDTGIR